MNAAPRAAYVHVPFCRHHCGYCNFTVIAGREDLADRYLAALERELAGLGTPSQVDTLYVGGGTPTRLESRQLARLLGMLDRAFPRVAGAEFTVEVNPADVDADRLAVLVDAGVNRASLGIQSFDDGKLQRLDRDHSAVDSYRAFEILSARLEQVAIDLMFAAPAESRTDWQRDLAEAIRLGPDHVSTYGLTFERGTVFWGQLQKGDKCELADEIQRDMYLDAIETLQSAGWEHYEVSNFARENHRSRHNQTYWLGERYFGVGAGASRYMGNERATNHRSTTRYIQRLEAGGDPTEEREQLDAETRARERLVFGLRMMEGVDLAAIEQATGFGLAELAEPQLTRYESWGLLVRAGTRWRLTREGLLVSDSLWPDLLALPA